MNAKADAMRKRIVDILGETIGIMVESLRHKKVEFWDKKWALLFMWTIFL